MLVVSRRIGESIVVDDGLIVVHVLEIRGDRVRLGVEAPREIKINRAQGILQPEETKEE